jgi:predicted Zn finger-like uncharacterized protein
VQTTCPQCSQGIIVDDARIPDGPFTIRCPRCKNAVRLSGKAAAPAASEPASETAAAAQLPQANTTVSEDARAQVAVQSPGERSSSDAGAAGRALVFLPDRGQAAAIAPALTRLGYAADTLEDGGEAARALDQGTYAVLVTARIIVPQGQPSSLYQRLNRLNADARRRVFVVLIGDDFKSGDGTQAFTALADLVVNSRDIAACGGILRAALQEKRRLYQVFLDARQRLEEV